MCFPVLSLSPLVDHQKKQTGFSYALSAFREILHKKKSYIFGVGMCFKPSWRLVTPGESVIYSLYGLVSCAEPYLFHVNAFFTSERIRYSKLNIYIIKNAMGVLICMNVVDNAWMSAELFSLSASQLIHNTTVDNNNRRNQKLCMHRKILLIDLPVGLDVCMWMRVTFTQSDEVLSTHPK